MARWVESGPRDLLPGSVLHWQHSSQRKSWIPTEDPNPKSSERERLLQTSHLHLQSVFPQLLFDSLPSWQRRDQCVHLNFDYTLRTEKLLSASSESGDLLAGRPACLAAGALGQHFSTQALPSWSSAPQLWALLTSAIRAGPLSCGATQWIWEPATLVEFTCWWLSREFRDRMPLSAACCGGCNVLRTFQVILIHS